MHNERPTRLERKLSKELEKEERREEATMVHHLHDIAKAEHHRQKAEQLRTKLVKLQIQEARLQERIEEHELQARQLEGRNRSL